jgi:hypothetical protein
MAIKVTNPDGTSFLSLQTYFANGEFVEDAKRSDIQNCLTREWVKTGPRQFLRTHTVLNLRPHRESSLE